jgi:hypothetical protein
MSTPEKQYVALFTDAQTGSSAENKTQPQPLSPEDVQEMWDMAMELEYKGG